MQSIILPSIWNINSGCRTKLNLYPFDPDRDSIKCSWTSDKNDITSHNPAFHLDQSQCILSYDPALDNWKTDKSVLKIDIQDYGEIDTEYFSRIPVQFTTKILKQDQSNSRDRCSRLSFKNQARFLSFDISYDMYYMCIVN